MSLVVVGFARTVNSKVGGSYSGQYDSSCDHPVERNLQSCRNSGVTKSE